MASMKSVKTKEKIAGTLRHGSDLLEELNEICRKKNIRLGRLEGLGAVQKACLGYYDQGKHEYRFFEIDRPLEITKLIGNISVKDADPFVHAHITLADRDGHAFGGHLAHGTIVFACEFMLEVFDGPVFERIFDETTGLALWDISEIE